MPLKLHPLEHIPHYTARNYLIRKLLSDLGCLRYNTAPTTITTHITSSSSTSTIGIATAAATFSINIGVGVGVTAEIGVTMEMSDSYECTHTLQLQYLLNYLLER